MDNKLTCFLSTPFDTDVSSIKTILIENRVTVLDLYDLSVGEPIQEILKRKLREADFAIFVLSKQSANILYEIGVCEGLGKQSLIIIDKGAQLPFYFENKLSLTANLSDKDFLRVTLESFIDEIKVKRKSVRKTKIIGVERKGSYNQETRTRLRNLLARIQDLRIQGDGRDLEMFVGDIFRSIPLKYVDNRRGPDSGIDFALWSNDLGRIIGNPIIVEVKFGKLNDETFKRAELQIKQYAEKSEAKIALLLYIDRSGRRYKLKPSLRPLIIAYDVEDFVTDLLQSNFENVILTSRNKIAHGD